MVGAHGRQNCKKNVKLQGILVRKDRNNASIYCIHNQRSLEQMVGEILRICRAQPSAPVKKHTKL